MNSFEEREEWIKIWMNGILSSNKSLSSFWIPPNNSSFFFHPSSLPSPLWCVLNKVVLTQISCSTLFISFNNNNNNNVTYHRSPHELTCILTHTLTHIHLVHQSKGLKLLTLSRLSQYDQYSLLITYFLLHIASFAT